MPPSFRRFHAAIVSRIKILSHLDIAEKRLPQDGRIKLKIAGREIDVRVSIIPMIHGEAVVLRILDRSDAILGTEHLGMADRDCKALRQAPRHAARHRARHRPDRLAARRRRSTPRCRRSTTSSGRSSRSRTRSSTSSAASTRSR